MAGAARTPGGRSNVSLKPTATQLECHPSARVVPRSDARRLISGVRLLHSLSVTLKNKMFIFLIIVIVVFLVLPILLVWRLYRAPIGGDILMQLMWRGAVAGIAGGSIGATLSSLIFGTGVYAPIGYFFWLLITAILGMVFTFMIGAVQKSGLSLNLFGRAALGSLIGMATAWVWASAIRMDFGRPMNWFAVGISSMIICGGIVSGILGGPLDREA